MPHDHAELLLRVKTELPTDELLSDLSDLFKIFADSTRSLNPRCACARSRSCWA